MRPVDPAIANSHVVLPDGATMHKATLVRYLNANMHLFGEGIGGKLDTSRLMRIIQGARNSTGNATLAEPAVSSTTVGVGDFVEFKEGTRSVLGIVFEIFNTRSDDSDKERRTRYYLPVDVAGSARSTLLFTCHSLAKSRSRRTYKIANTRLTVRAASCTAKVQMDIEEGEYKKISSVQFPRST